MTKNEFYYIISKNIVFSSKSDKIDFYKFYDELIYEMVQLGKTEEEVISSLNINEIINQYKETKHSNYVIETKIKDLKNDLRAFNCSVLFGLMIPIIILMINFFIIYIKKETIDFWDHSIRLAVTIILFFFYEVFFRINEIYLFIKKRTIVGDKKTMNKVLYIVAFIVCWFLTTAFIYLLFYLFINENFVILFFLTTLLFLPYVYFIFRKRRLINEKGA